MAENFSRAIQRRQTGQPGIPGEGKGLAGLRTGQGGPQVRAPDVINNGPVGGPTPPVAAIPDAAAPSPGVANVTPGAIERRLGFNPPSFQARGGMAPGPSAAASAMVQHMPNQQGPARQVLNAPVAGISSLLNQLRNRR